jgi:hypothetical protein
MPPRRRDRQIPDPPEEREMPRRRDRQLLDPARESEMHELLAKLDAMETSERHIIDAMDINEFESENEDRTEEVAVEDATEERLLGLLQG